MQNPEVFQVSELEGFDPTNRLAFLHLNTTTPPTTTTTAATGTTSLFSDPHCTTCGTSMKRRSPSSLSEPKSKKPMMFQEDNHLPISFPTTFVPSPPPGTTPPDSVTGAGVFLNPHSSPDDFAVKSVDPSPTRGNSSLPPRPPVLHRTVSDPIPSAYLPSVAGQALARSNSGLSTAADLGVSLPLDTVKEESPNSKRLTRMKDRMKQMNQWLGEVMREGEDNASDSEDSNSNAGQDAFGSEVEEEVSVERLGEGLSVNFRCPCGKGCQILLSGRHCYYKLI